MARQAERVVERSGIVWLAERRPRHDACLCAAFSLWRGAALLGLGAVAGAFQGLSIGNEGDIKVDNARFIE